MCNDFVVALYLRMEETAVKQLERNQHNIITSCEVQTAVGLLLSGELATRAVAKGMEAERKFKSTQGLPKSERAGVTFPVGRLHALLKFRLKQNQSQCSGLLGSCPRLCGERDTGGGGHQCV